MKKSLISIISIIAMITMNKVYADKENFSFMVRGYNLYDAPTEVKFSGNSYEMIMRGDNIDDQMQGIGIVEGEVDQRTRSEMQSVVEKAPLDEGIWTSTATIDRYAKPLFKDGIRRSKLDVLPRIQIDSSGALLVSLDFQNSGKEDISITSPKTWEGQVNRILKSSGLNIMGKIAGGSNDDYFLLENLGGAQVVESKDLDNGPFVVHSGDTRTVKFLAFPDKPIKKGSYQLSASITVKQVFSPLLLKGFADFASLYGYVEFPRDYPSTPTEIKAFNAYLKSQEAQ